MLKYNKIKTDFGYTINIYDSNKILTITFGGNLDLYWYLKGKEEKEVDTFEITKENYFLYSLFDILYNDIVKCNIFNVSSIEKVFVYSLKELENLYKIKEELNEKLLDSEEYKKSFEDAYNDLDTAYNLANEELKEMIKNKIFIMIKQENEAAIKFCKDKDWYIK